MMGSVIKPVYVTINSPAGLSTEEEGALGVRAEGKEEGGLGEGAGGDPASSAQAPRDAADVQVLQETLSY